MTRRIVLIKDPLAGESAWEYFDVAHYGEWLKAHYDARLPNYVALYHEHVALDRNVTPKTPEEIEKLFALEGDVFVVEYPHYGYEIVAYVIYAVILVAVMLSARKDVPAIPGNRNRNQTSSNNDLAGRQNKARPNARIPDIYGEVIAVPDLLSKTYSVFKNHEEYEYSFMCIGRGEYQVEEVKDDTTLIQDIEGAAVGVYGPDTSPNSGLPFLSIGDPINETLLSVVRTEAVNGQTLVPPNDDVFTTAMKFQWPNRLIAPDGTGIDFTTLYVVGDVIDISASWFWGYDYLLFFGCALNGPGGIGTIGAQSDGTITGLSGFGDDGSGSPAPINIAGRWIQITGGGLDGIYPVASDNGAGTVVLADPELVNANWSSLSGTVTITPSSIIEANLYAQNVSMTGEYTISEVTESYIAFENPAVENPNWAYTYVAGGTGTAPFSPPNSTTNVTLALDGGIDNWVGPFDVQLADMTNFIANFVATNGMYADDGTNQTARTVVVEIEYTPIDLEGSPMGAALTYRRTVQGSAITTARRALTVRATTDFFAAPAGRFRARRLTPKDTSFAGQIVDEVQWKDLYATSPVSQEHFGNVTTVQSVTRATSNALSVKNRKLNMRVTRKLPLLSLSGGSPGYEFSGTLQPTRDAADIFAAICLDPKIGNRPLSEVDFVNLRTTSDAIAEYFNRESPRYFNYTFDDDNISFEEMANTIADAIFCTALRRGNVIQWHFERTVEDASLIFNHRNKVPRSEKRTITWGTQGGYDGIEYEYIDRLDGSMQTIYLPEDRSAVKAKTISSVGVMGVTQATLHAYRNWNKIRFQRCGVEFVATRQGELLQRNMPILVANNVRSGTQDGEVVSKAGLVLQLSQPVTFEPGVDYAIHLQAHDATVQSMGVTAGVDAYHVVIEEEPTVPLSLDNANQTKAVYYIVPDTQIEPTMFLVSDRSYDGPMTSRVTAINYDPRYYAQDTLFAGRIARYSEEPLDSELVYDDATEEQRDEQAFYAEENGLIPTINDPAYVFAEGTDDGEL